MTRKPNEFDASRVAAESIRTTRQFLHARLGLPLAALGCIVLSTALVQQLQFDGNLAFSVVAAVCAFALAVVALGEWRLRKRGMWARPAGDPSLAAPGRPDPDPTTTSRIQIGALLVFGALVAGAYFYGVTTDTVMFWIMTYGLLHMAVYCLSLGLNLRMREQILSFAWFVVGVLYWVKTGHAIALVFGGGWLLAGLLLYARLRHFERLARVSGSDDRTEEVAP